MTCADVALFFRQQNYIQSRDELLSLKRCQNRRFFGNFSQLVDVLREEVEISPEGRHSPENINLVSKILEQIEFNPKYAQFSWWSHRDKTR